MNKNRLVCGLILVTLLSSCLWAQDSKFEPQEEQIPGPGRLQDQRGPVLLSQ